MSTEIAAGLPALLVLNPQDNVAVARAAIAAGAGLTLPDGTALTAQGEVPAGHKIALRGIAKDEVVRKYGQVIGFATRDIAAGEHVHTQNLDMSASHPSHGVGHAYVPTQPVPEPATFEGYVRRDGRVGTRNYVGVVSSVNCSATVSKAIAQAFAGDAMQAWPGVDGVVAITHGSGCGMSGSGEGIELLQRTLRGYADHPNFAAVLVVGLGCEVNQVGTLVEALDAREPGSVVSMTIQDAGGTREAIAQGQAIVRDMLVLASKAKRSTVPASHLVVGLQCGGGCAGAPWRHGGAVGDARDLRCRASAHGTSGAAGGGADAAAAHPLVGGLHREERRRHEQQPVAGQQGGRHHDHP